MPVEAVVDERLVGLLALGTGQGRAVQDQAVEQSMASGRERDEAAAPEGLIAEGLGIEAGGQLAAIAEPDADAFGDGHPRASEDAAEQVAQVGLVPATVDPGRRRSGCPSGRAFRRRGRGTAAARPGYRRLLREMLGLLGVEVIDPVAVDRMLPVRPSLGVQRPAIERELGRRVRMAEQVPGGTQPRPSEVQQEADEVTALDGRHRRGEAARASVCLRCGWLRCPTWRSGSVDRSPGRGASTRVRTRPCS